METKSSFAERLISWQRVYGRNDLPWQSTHDPYARWLAEIMLQQTQVKTVIPYYRTFLSHYPTVSDLAVASEEEVLRLWAGMGYYSRARNLHRCAQKVVRRFNGKFPVEEEELMSLPGIGRSTAAAIRSAVTDEPCAILDGNVKRVLARYFLIGQGQKQSETEKQLWEKAWEMLPDRDGRTYAQAMMDLGATLCTRNNPTCSLCPVKENCAAFREGCQADYPVRKERKAIPEEVLTLGVWLSDGKVYLVRRESRYWKGLWTLPEAEEKEENETLPLIEHRLTHLLLRIYPRLMKTLPNPVPKEWKAFSRQEVEKGALPTPIKKLLLEVL